MKNGSINGETNGDKPSENGRDRHGRFTSGGRGGPGRPAAQRRPINPEAAELFADIAASETRIDALLADIRACLLTGRAAADALVIEHRAWLSRGRRLKELEQRQR